MWRIDQQPVNTGAGPTEIHHWCLIVLRGIVERNVCVLTVARNGLGPKGPADIRGRFFRHNQHLWLNRLALRRPFLSDEAAQLRKSFSDKYLHEDESFWYSWWFSDEVTIDRTDSDYTKWPFYSAVSPGTSISKASSDNTTGRESS